MTLPSEMTAIAITAPGEPEVLQPVHLPLPQPRPDEVLIRVAAAGVNAPDLSQRRGCGSGRCTGCSTSGSPGAVMAMAVISEGRVMAGTVAAKRLASQAVEDRIRSQTKGCSPCSMMKR
jgi:NADPH:quinone reductase-like Zn-dependent oxidoreductase